MRLLFETTSADGWLGRFTRAGIDFLYPPVCPLCQQEVSPTEARFRGGFCTTCREGLARRQGGTCLRCGGTIGPYLDPTAGCSYCKDEKYVFERVIRLGVYEDLLQSACLRGKHAGSESLLRGLASLLWDMESQAFLESQIDLVIPVPVFWQQRIFRSHDTTETLGLVWSRQLKRPLARHILKKSRRTESQATLGPHERRHNLRNAFAVRRPARLKGACVLLVDDVMTTGATANESAKVLKKAGAERVVVAVLARGLGHRN